jgi:hypothetical protein
MPRKVLISRTHNVAVKRYIAISRKSEKIVAGSDTRQGLADLLKKKRVRDVFIIEKPKVREATIMNISKKQKLPKKYWLGAF